jgi:aspartate racemase
VPSRIKALIDGSGEDPAPELASMARRLQRAGADVLAMPCNTAHNFADAIVSAVDVPLLNMVDLTVERILSLRPRARNVGLLASSALKITGLYNHALAPHQVNVVFPRQQDEVMGMIRAVKANTLGADQIPLFSNICRQLADDGTDVLLLACTELSVLASRLEARDDMIDSLTVLAEAVADLGGSR